MPKFRNASVHGILIRVVTTNCIDYFLDHVKTFLILSIKLLKNMLAVRDKLATINHGEIMKGCAYYNLMYPGFITLPDGFSCIIKLKNRIACILILKKVQAMRITDFANGVDKKVISENRTVHNLRYPIQSIKEESVTVEYNDTEYFIYETKDQYNRIFQSDYYTDLMISVDAENAAEEQLSIEILEKFISEYRAATHNYWILPPDDLFAGNQVIKTDFHHYSDEEKKIKAEDRLRLSRRLSLGMKQLQYRSNRFNMNFTKEQIDQHAQALLQKLALDQKTAFCVESILRAQQELIIFKNYKYAFIELFFAIESMLSDFLTKEKIKHGISNNKIKDYRGEVGVSYLINIEIRLVLNNLTTDEIDILGKVDSIRKKRNEIVHNNSDVSEKEATEAIKIAEDFINLLKRNGA